MPSPQEILSLDVVLTARCNLKCAYCYQDDKSAKRMDWPTLQASIDLLLAADAPEVDLVFYGGEPLLELPLIRRAVAYVQRKSPVTKSVRYTISTNGLLLDEETADFLARHDFRTQLSFDGVPEAQGLRGAGTFAKLDALLERLRVRQSRFLRNNLNINITLTTTTIPNLADSVEYFIAKGVAKIEITPAFTHFSEWRPEMYDELERQFERVRLACLDVYRRSGEVPLPLLRRTRATPKNSLGGRTMCGVPRGDSLAVDVDGRVSSCVTLVDSYQKFSRPFLRDRARSLELGDLRDRAGLARGLEKLPVLTRESGLFHAKQDKYSSYGRCGDCRFLQSCMVCPVSIGHAPGNEDPNRVPDLHCAFNLIALEQREQFPIEPDVRDLLTGRAPVPGFVTELLQHTVSPVDSRE